MSCIPSLLPLLHAFLILSSSTPYARGQSADDSGPGSCRIVLPSQSTTITIDVSTSSPSVGTNVQPPDGKVSALAGHLYFYIDYDCYGKTDLEGWQNRGKYVEQALRSDLHWAKGFHASVYQKNASINLKKAANWVTTRILDIFARIS